MDSGNSGSFQSSSGGDDEFDDSRCGGGGIDSSSLSALLRQSAASPSPSASGFGGSFYRLQDLATTPLPPLPQAVHHWSVALPAGGGGASPSSSSSHGTPASADQAAPAPQPAPPAAAPRGSRKRTRASRRAPTTVLTTDTTNFRAMVQEFTGIPSPPFAGTSSRGRFDHLFPSPSSLRSAPGAAASFPPYLLRPFAHKAQPSPFPSFAASPSTSSPEPSNSAVALPTASTSVAAAASGDSYQYHLLSSAPPPALLGMGNHSGDYLSFHSPLGAQLGSNAKYGFHPLFDAASHGLAPPSASSPRLQDPGDFSGRLTHGSEAMHLHPRTHDHVLRGDELSGLVSSASGTGSGSRRRTYSSDDASAKPLLDRSVESTSAGVAATTTTTTAVATATMRTQGVDSWICTSE